MSVKKSADNEKEKQSLLDLALDVDMRAIPKIILIAASRRGNLSGIVFMSTSRWAKEAGIGIITFRAHRNSLIERGFLTETGRGRDGRKKYIIERGALLAHQLPTTPRFVSDIHGECNSEPQNHKQNPKRKLGVPADTLSIQSEASSSSLRLIDDDRSVAARAIIKNAFPKHAHMFDGRFHFDDPGLKIFAQSKADLLWLRDAEHAITKLLINSGFNVDWVIIDGE